MPMGIIKKQSFLVIPICGQKKDSEQNLNLFYLYQFDLHHET